MPQDAYPEQDLPAAKSDEASFLKQSGVFYGLRYPDLWALKPVFNTAAGVFQGNRRVKYTLIRYNSQESQQARLGPPDRRHPVRLLIEPEFCVFVAR